VTDSRQQMWVLFRHFLGGFLESDALAPAGDMHGLLSRLMALILLPAALYPVKLLFGYGYPFASYDRLDLYSLGDKSLFVLVSMVVVGLATAVEWDTLQLDRRDSLALGTLPLTTSTVVLAKVASLGAFLLILSAPLSIVGAIVFPTIMHTSREGTVAAALRTMGGHLVGTLAAAWFTFLFLLAIRTALQGVARWRWGRGTMTAVQLAATLLCVVTFLMLPFIASSTVTLKAGASGLAGFAPHMWFVGIYQVAAGRGDADWALLATRGWLALAWAAAMASLGCLVSFRRVLGRSLEAAQAGGNRRSLWSRAVALVARLTARTPAERGFFVFAAVTLTRSAWHRVVLAASLGGALAIALVTLAAVTLGRDGGDRLPVRPEHALAMQWVVVLVTLAGIRAAAAVPAELRARWVLRMADAGDPWAWMSGFRKATLIMIVGPVIVIMGVGVCACAGWRIACQQAVAVSVFAGLAFEALFQGFGRVPFGCSFDGASAEPKVLRYIAVAAFTILVAPVAVVVTWAMRSAEGVTALVLPVIGLFVWSRRRERRLLRSAGGLAFTFEQSGTQTLELGP
jgi:hypothetical protein